MNLLIDTHIFLNLIEGDKTINRRLIGLFEDITIKKYLSIASIWEIVIKLNIGKLEIEGGITFIYQLISEFEIFILSIEKKHLKTYLTLPLLHRDPFDRLIISQAIGEDLTLVTDDAHIKNYPSLNLL